MNKKRRKKLREACLSLEQALRILEQAKDEEQDSMDSLPENLQNSDRFASMENTVDELDDAISKIEEANENVRNIC